VDFTLKTKGAVTNASYLAFANASHLSPTSFYSFISPFYSYFYYLRFKS
jgi:hypothetical protein